MFMSSPTPSPRTLIFQTDDGERYAIHIASVIVAARCSTATAQRAANEIGRAPVRGYVWADSAARWVVERLARYPEIELPVWVRIHVPVP